MLPWQGAQVPSLVEELRFHLSRGVAKKIKSEEKMNFQVDKNVLINSIEGLPWWLSG